jgi:hypothetical protein
MAGKNTKGDTALLSYIAEYKFLTIKQLSALSKRPVPSIHRRRRHLEKEHLIVMTERGFGSGRGRREIIIFMTRKGLEFLRHQEVLSEHAAYITDKTTDSIFLEHDLLVNWFFIHLLQIKRENRQLATQCLTTSSHDLRMGTADNPLLQERFATDETFENVRIMIPDGVFTISHQEKALLFFLEVDMGTETLASSKPGAGDVRQKILNYQSLFRTGHYKRYEKIFDAEFNGFRLLFLTNSLSRSKKIGELVQAMPPSDFIWVTDQNRMFEQGVSAEIWARGGCHHKPPESILGPKLAFHATVTDNIR